MGDRCCRCYDLATVSPHSPKKAASCRERDKDMKMGQRRREYQSSPEAGLLAAICPILLHLFTEQTQTRIEQIALAEKRTQKGRKELSERHSVH